MEELEQSQKEQGLGHIVDGIIPKKKSSNSSKTIRISTASRPICRSLSLDARVDIISSPKTLQALRAEYSNILEVHSQELMKESLG